MSGVCLVSRQRLPGHDRYRGQAAAPPRRATLSATGRCNRRSALIKYGLGRFRAWPIGGGERISPAAEATGFTVRGHPQIPELVPDMLSLAGLIVVGDRCLDAVTLSEVDCRAGWRTCRAGPGCSSPRAGLTSLP
jgi:hypothetical protein